MGRLLRQRYGAQEFYTPEQVVKTCESANLDDLATDRSIAIYVEPKISQGILSRLNKSQSANALRKYLIVRCFDSFSEGEQPDHNAFAHPSAHEGFHSGGESFDSFDGGHSGDGGGGHH
jgi:hypothetical protein